MRSHLSKFNLIFLTLWVLVIQVAGSSAQLHGFLHGETEQANTCGGDHPCSHDSDSPRSDHVCSVVLLAEGIVTADVLVFIPDSGVEVSSLAQIIPAIPNAGFLGQEQARAPPVL